MNPRLQKHYAERDKCAAAITRLTARHDELNRKIMEGENLEIRAVMKAENITLEELIALAHSMRQDQKPIPPLREEEVFPKDIADKITEDEDE